MDDDYGYDECDDECDEYGYDDEPYGSHDLSDDAWALASAGHGTDEDYGLFDSGDWD